MKTLINILLVVSISLFLQPIWAADPVEEARGAFTEMVAAAKAANIDQFKSHILPKDLAEMEKEGATRMVMMMWAKDDPAIFNAEVNSDYILFTHEIKEESPNSSMTMRKEAYMFKYKGQWKFGTPQ
jgi:hypothetical protein